MPKNRNTLTFFLLYILQLLVLVWLYYYYFNASFYVKIPAAEKLLLLQKRLEDFWWWAFIFYCSALAFSNWIAYKEKQLAWLFSAVLLVVAAAFSYTNGLEEIFVFKKQNGFWKGEFSLSFLEAFFYSFIALTVWLINQLLLKRILKNEQKK